MSDDFRDKSFWLTTRGYEPGAKTPGEPGGFRAGSSGVLGSIVVETEKHSLSR